MGLERPTSGTVEVCGRERSASRPHTRERRRRAREMQLVFQDPYLSLDRTQRVADIVETAVRLQFKLGRREVERRAADLLDKVGLLPRQGKLYPRQLSGGQRQRVAIARARRRRSRGRAGRPGAGRGGRRAGRLDPGPGAEPALRHPRRRRHLLPLHLPRPGRGQPAVRAHAGDAPGRGGRGGRHPEGRLRTASWIAVAASLAVAVVGRAASRRGARVA